MFKLRYAEQRDAPGLATVMMASWRAAFLGQLDAAELGAMDHAQLTRDWETHLAGVQWPSSGVLVASAEADADCSIIGYCRFYPSEDDGENAAHVATVGSLYVVPEHWRTGLGTKLLGAVLDDMHQGGYAQATLWVLAGNRRARSFYEAKSWVADGAAESISSGDRTVEKIRYRLSLERH